MTYTEIEAEAAQILAGRQHQLPPHAMPVAKAFMQQTSGLTVKEHCPYCGEMLLVAQPGPEVWSVTCPCGRSHATFRGL